eukprot:522770_1
MPSYLYLSDKTLQILLRWQDPPFKRAGLVIAISLHTSYEYRVFIQPMKLSSVVRFRLDRSSSDETPQFMVDSAVRLKLFELKVLIASATLSRKEFRFWIRNTGNFIYLG